MTGPNYRESFRALFLTALMVVSVFGGTIAFAGGAAATVSEASIDGDSTVTPGTSVSITGDVNNDATDVQIYVDENQNGQYDDGERTVVGNAQFSGSFSTDITAPSSSGTYTIYVDQPSPEDESALSLGDAYSDTTTDDSVSLTVDGDGPVFNSASPTGALTTQGGDITVDVSDDLDSVDASSIEVSVSEDGTEVYSTTDASANFVDGTLTLDPGTTTDLPALSEGSSYTVDVTAADTLGNSASTSFSFDYDYTAPTFGDATVAGNALPDTGTLTVATTTPTIVQPISDEEFSVDSESIEVTLSDSDGVIYTYSVGSETADDGVSFSGGELVVEPGTGDVPELEAGTSYTLDVTAADTAGNDDSTAVSFDVDTAAPSISNFSPADDALVNDATTEISADVGADADTATLTIEGPDGYSVSFDETDGVFTSNTFSVTPGTTTDVPELPDGDITVSATATDAQGNTASDSATFEVDTQGPTATDIAADFSVNSDNSDSEEITVTFDEPVVPNTVTVDVNDAEDGDITTLDGTGTDPTTTVTIPFDITTDEDTEASLSVTDSAADAAGNSLAADETDTTVSIDTINPSVTVGPLNGNGIASGYVDLTEDVTPSSDDGETVTYAVLPGGDGSYTAADDEGDLVTIDNPTNVNTNAYPEGAHTLVVTITDDAGNAVTDYAALTIDNTDPSVTFTEDTTLTGEVTVGDLVTVDDLGVESATVTVYKDSNPDPEVTERTEVVSTSLAEAGETTFNVNEEGSGAYFVEVSATDPGYDGFANVEAEFEGQTLDTPSAFTLQTADEVERVESDNASTLVVTYDSTSELSELNVTVGTLDDYVEQSSTEYTIEDFTESEDAGTYTYTLTQETTRDGMYQVAFDDAKLGEQTLLADDFAAVEDTTDTVDVDTRAIEMIDADVSGVDAGRTQVTVTFSEPVEAGTVAQTAFGFDGTAGIAGVSDATEHDGEQTVTFDSEIQTGTGAELTFTDTNPTDDVESSVVVDSVELDLSEGANLVSVPVETGEVALDSMDLSDVNVVWAYDNGAWESYDPDADENAFTALEGGQGYIFMADADTTVDARGYTVPAADTSGDQPTVPTAEGLDEGWNLVGHFQEGTQTLGDYGPLNAVDSTVAGVGPLGQAGTGYSYVTVSEFAPGEGYWVFTDSSDVYTAVDYENEGTATMPSITEASAKGAADSNGEVNSGEQITVSATVSNANSVTVNAEWLGMKTLEQTDGTGPYTATFNVPAEVSDGSKTLTVTARDSVGAEDTETVSVTLNRNLDTLEITQLDETNSEIETLATTDSVTVDAEDDESVQQLDYTITDSGETPTEEATGQVGDDMSIPIPDLTDDVYTVTVTAVDQGDKQTTSQFRIKSAANDLTLNAESSSILDSAVQTGTSVTHEIDLQLSGVSKDGNSDVVYIEVPNEVAQADNFDVSSSPSSEQSSSTSSSNIVSGSDGDQVDDTIKFDISSGGGDTYAPLIELSVNTQYTTSDTDFPYDVRVEDSDGDTLDYTTFATVTTDDTAPSIQTASKSGSSPTTVDVTLKDTGVGFDASTVDASDFDVTNSGTSVVDTNNGGVVVNTVNDGDGTVTATITLDGDHSSSEVTAEIVGDISDLAGNTVSSDSQVANTAQA
jgi:surface glycoprotein (TIGR04207 family)